MPAGDHRSPAPQGKSTQPHSKSHPCVSVCKNIGFCPHNWEVMRQFIKHDPVLLGSSITSQLSIPMCLLSPILGHQRKRNDYYFLIEDGKWCGFAVPVITQKRWGRAGNLFNLPLLSTPFVFFLCCQRQRVWLTAPRGEILSSPTKQVHPSYERTTC